MLFANCSIYVLTNIYIERERKLAQLWFSRQSIVDSKGSNSHRTLQNLSSYPLNNCHSTQIGFPWSRVYYFYSIETLSFSIYLLINEKCLWLYIYTVTWLFSIIVVFASCLHCFANYDIKMSLCELHFFLLFIY